MIADRQDFSVAIVGAGAAGAAMARVLAQKGVDVALIDPRPPHVQDFRAEKLTPAQWGQVRTIDLDSVLAPVMTLEPEVWVARRGQIVERAGSGNRNYRYPALVEALRGAAHAEPKVHFVESRVAEIDASDDVQRLRLADGTVLTARLVVIATGPGAAMAEKLGYSRETIFAGHSLSVGFDARPVSGAFPFPALTWFAERPSDRYAYLSLFPIGEAMRANLFLYRDIGDPVATAFRADPQTALRALIPGLERMFGPVAVDQAAAMRPVDLYRMRNVERSGVALIGDAFGTACPASGSGLDKVFSDVERLAVHAPLWLQTPGMGAEKLAQFYGDRLKIAADAQSLARSRKLREMSTGEALPWKMRRTLGFFAQAARGKLRETRAHFALS